jgi:hypothetical protein
MMAKVAGKDKEITRQTSEWVLVACDPALLQRPSIKEAAEPVALRPGLKVWTDDHNDLISALK